MALLSIEDATGVVDVVFEQLEGWRLQFCLECGREPTMREMFACLPKIRAVIVETLRRAGVPENDHESSVDDFLDDIMRGQFR